MRLAYGVFLLVFGATGFGQVKSRELEDLFNSDSLKPRPVASVKKPLASGASKPVAGVPAGHDPDRHLLRRAGLKCRVQLVTKEGVREIDPAGTFRSGDRIRLVLEPNIDGYLYIIQTGSSGKESILFPHRSTNGGRNEVLRGRLYSIPSVGLFRFDGQPGEERIQVILSRTPLQSLPGEALESTNVQLAMNTIGAELQAQVRARDLVYVSEEGPASADPSRSPAQAVIWLNKSAEQNNVVFFELKLRHE